MQRTGCGNAGARRVVKQWGWSVLVCCAVGLRAAADGNALAYLEQDDPFYVHRGFPKLTTPQWVGESNVEAVVILAVDDMRDAGPYEVFLRPILERLKRVDGRAPVSIMANAVDPAAQQFQVWLKEGLSLEVHTLSHPCPLLANGNFQAAANNYHGGVELLSRVAGNHPVAFRMPCCDSMNSPSPRFYAEIFARTNAAGQFLAIDSSVMNLTTSRDASLPRRLVFDEGERERFGKYLPRATNAVTRVSMGSFATTIEDYPYPYVIGGTCWEFPAMIPSDWEASNLWGPSRAQTVADWQAALEVCLLKQGVFTFIFHPHGWITSEQMVEFIDGAVTRYGSRVKFLTFREALERLNRHLLGGHALRGRHGQSQGIRLIDLNQDGFLDVVLGHPQVRRTRLWEPQAGRWRDMELPEALGKEGDDGRWQDGGVRWGVIGQEKRVLALVSTHERRGAWVFERGAWVESPHFLRGLAVQGAPVHTAEAGRDRGVRFRDVDADGSCELVVSNPQQNSVLAWDEAKDAWAALEYGLPEGVQLVDDAGRDRGVRWVDLNEDGYDDLLWSSWEGWSVHLFLAKAIPNWDWREGWTRLVRSGKPGEVGSPPMLVRDGVYRNNGAWFRSGYLWVQNEDTAHLPDRVDRRALRDLIAFAAPPPRTPEESLGCFRVRPGFTVELAAAEPLVEDPVAFAWGAEGRLWVVEMRDYPSGLDGHGKPGGRVRWLEDLNGDGRYDRSTVFLDDLPFPTGVMPWRDGVLVSAAPEIFYAQDTDDDGKADRREVLLTGFGLGNQQHRVNGFEYGLDNWVYAANGDSGGDIRVAGRAEVMSLRGQDFRFRPDDRGFQLIEGQTQFGRRRDDWGNWFGNNNPTWLWHFYLSEEYLRRNPLLPVRTTRRILANYDQPTRAHAISPTMARFNWPNLVNTVTSANSPTPYRDEVFGDAFATTVFISEPAHNLVHREVLEEDGVSFKSRRAAGEEEVEFLASTDNWFRPTMLATGPDGALYVADMYRLVIEHPEYALADMAKQIDLRAGSDRGRIYRVAPTGALLRAVPRLDRLDTPGLVAALASPNGWQRDTVQRLLVHRADTTARAPLERLARSHRHPKVRLQALCTMDGLAAVTPELLSATCRDEHPMVRAHSLRLSERFLRQVPPPAGSELLRAEWPRLVRDPSSRVRQQLALTLGECPVSTAGETLVELMNSASAQSALWTAILSSATPHLSALCRGLFKQPAAPYPAEFIQTLSAMVVEQRDTEALMALLNTSAGPPTADGPLWAWHAVGSLLEARAKAQAGWQDFPPQPDRVPKDWLARVQQRIQESTALARRMATQVELESLQRLAALRVVGASAAGQPEDLRLLVELLGPRHPLDIQESALRVLKAQPQEQVGRELVAGWPGFGPRAKNDVLSLLLDRASWTGLLLTALEQGSIPRGAMQPASQQRLLQHRDPALRQRAAKLFEQIDPDRQRVVERYADVESMKGDPQHGAALFRQHCGSCHRLREEGTALGPDLSALGSQPWLFFVSAILDPNRAVEPPYVLYTVQTKQGEELTGVIVSETANSLVLRSAGGIEQTLLRRQLTHLDSSGMSAMPEGMEQILNPEAMADLLSFLAPRREKQLPVKP